MAELQRITDGTITTTPGVQAAGVAAGLKKNGNPDVALLVSATPCAVAGVFTLNEIKAAPVRWCQNIVAGGAPARAVVINSGCANAVTGAQGDADTAATAAAVAAAVGCAADEVLVLSTGVIGQHLPMPKLLAGVEQAAAALSTTADAGHTAARAIMTTDTRPKEIAVRCIIDGRPVTISGLCKGAGMIHPNMATMLAVLWTDAAIAPAALQRALGFAADRSFNAMTVDGDSSTNDTLLVLASGLAGNDPITEESESFALFQAALTAAAAELAQLIARDGEGATKFVTLTVSGARSFAEAQRIAKTIATSALVKTALYGADANWGRVLAAAGRAGVALAPERLALWFDAVQLVGAGAPLPYLEADAHATLTKPEVTIQLDLGLGDASATVWTCDFSHDYVSINADYRS